MITESIPFLAIRDTQAPYLRFQVGQAAVDGGERASLESEVEFVGLGSHARSLPEHAIKPGEKKRPSHNKGTMRTALPLELWLQH